VSQGTAPGTHSGRPPVDRAGRWVDRAFRTHAALVYLFLYVPIGLVVLFSFNAGDLTGELRGLSLRWYARALDDRFAMAALQNSLVVGAWTAILATSFGTIAALALLRAPRPVRAVFDAITYVAIIIPGIVIGIATLIFFVNMFGWVNPWLEYLWASAALGTPPTIRTGLHTIVAAHVVFTMAIVMILVRARLAGMDRSLTEASFDLFAPPLRTFVQVTLPQLWPAIITGALLAFTFSFDDFIIASFVAGPGQPTLPMYVFASIRRGITPEINAIASMVLGVTVTALVIVGLVYRRQARQDRTADDLERGDLAVAVPVAEEPR
jgi:spermidine/putrescine transport system permease protein